jgi:putative membrane protein
MKKLVAQLIGGIIGIFLAVKILEGVVFSGSFGELIILGAIIGLLNFFVKPVLKIVTLPFRIITLGLFDIVINMIIVWGAAFLYPVLQITGTANLLLATLIVWFLSFVIAELMDRK